MFTTTTKGQGWKTEDYVWLGRESNVAMSQQVALNNKHKTR